MTNRLLVEQIWNETARAKQWQRIAENRFSRPTTYVVGLAGFVLGIAFTTMIVWLAL